MRPWSFQGIERPLQVAARLAGRSPQLDIVALALANWAQDDHKEVGALWE